MEFRLYILIVTQDYIPKLDIYIYIFKLMLFSHIFS